MFSLTKTVSARLMPALSVKVCGVRHKGTVNIPTISPPQPINELTAGPYPRTPEERLKAARKYNLIPEDYEPYPEDEGWGDYPKLPAVGSYNRDKYEDFDDIFGSRHFGETLHRDHDLYTWERLDPLEGKKIPPLFPYKDRYMIFILSLATLPIFDWLFERLKLNINQNHKIREFNHGRQRYEFPPSHNDNVHHHSHH